MKRFFPSSLLRRLFPLLLLLLTSVGLYAKDKTLEKVTDYNPVAYICATEPMLRSGLQLSSYGLPMGITQHLTFLELASVTTNFEEVRKIASKVRKDMDEIVSINAPNIALRAWAAKPKNDVYPRVLLGIGTPGRLTYILLEGEITGKILNQVLNLWM